VSSDQFSPAASGRATLFRLRILRRDKPSAPLLPSLGGLCGWLRFAGTLTLHYVRMRIASWRANVLMSRGCRGVMRVNELSKESSESNDSKESILAPDSGPGTRNLSDLSDSCGAQANCPVPTAHCPLSTGQWHGSPGSSYTFIAKRYTFPVHEDVYAGG
jgi:hypothetical protein